MYFVTYAICRSRYLNDGYGNGDIVLWNTVYDLDPLNGTNEFGLTAKQEARSYRGRGQLVG